MSKCKYSLRSLRYPRFHKMFFFSSFWRDTTCIFTTGGLEKTWKLKVLYEHDLECENQLTEQIIHLHLLNWVFWARGRTRWLDLLCFERSSQKHSNQDFLILSARYKASVSRLECIFATFVTYRVKFLFKKLHWTLVISWVFSCYVSDDHTQIDV